MTDLNLRVLVVDDEPAIRRFLRASLTAHGNEVFEAATGEEALAGVADHRPDLVILDLGLPDMDGVQVTQQLRAWTRIPIIILSVHEHERDKIAALNAGADDYLTKPFGIGELLARMRTAIRHTMPVAAGSIFSSGELVLDLEKRIVSVAGREIHLTPTEYDLLRALVLQAGKVLTHNQLMRAVWGAEFKPDMHMLRVNISNLRRKIECDPTRPRYILTEPGVGYRLHSD